MRPSRSLTLVNAALQYQSNYLLTQLYSIQLDSTPESLLSSSWNANLACYRWRHHRRCPSRSPTDTISVNRGHVTFDTISNNRGHVTLRRAAIFHPVSIFVDCPC